MEQFRLFVFTLKERYMSGVFRREYKARLDGDVINVDAKRGLIDVEISCSGQ